MWAPEDAGAAVRRAGRAARAMGKRHYNDIKDGPWTDRRVPSLW